MLMAHQWIPFAVSTPMQEAVAVALEQAGERGYFAWLGAMYQAKRDRLLDVLERGRPDADDAGRLLLHRRGHELAATCRCPPAAAATWPSVAG